MHFNTNKAQSITKTSDVKRVSQKHHYVFTIFKQFFPNNFAFNTKC